MAYRSVNRPNAYATAASIKTYRAESADYLRRLFPPGTEVTTVVRNVVRSGMARTISVFAIEPARTRNGHREPARIVNVSRHVARVLDWRYDDERAGVYVTGCGMDMCFHTVYSLARVLYSGNKRAERHATEHRNGTDGGYVLTSRTV